MIAREEHSEFPYPQLSELREDAVQTCPRFASPEHIRAAQDVVHRRGFDWCTAVLGRSFGGLRQVSMVESHMLLLADERNLEPALPQHIRQARAAQAARLEEQQRRDEELARRDQDAWRHALATCQVNVEVRANRSGRRYRTSTNAGPLRHVVPLAPAATGTGRQPRQHQTGRALCETPTRARPLQLSDPVELPATCVRCLAFTAELRPADG